MNTVLARIVAASALVLGLPQLAVAAPVELLTNGNFEAGSLAGWTVSNGTSVFGNWYADAPGSTTPETGQTTSATGGRPHGRTYAVTDQGGSGAHALLQSFTVAPGSTNVILSFDLFANDQSGKGPLCDLGFIYTGGPVQCARVDILSAGADDFDIGAGVLANYYLGVDAGENPHPFTSYSFDISALVAGGGTFKLRFGETDNQLFLNMGVDNVSILAGAIPEPSTFALTALALAGLGFAACRKTRPQLCYDAAA